MLSKKKQKKLVKNALKACADMAYEKKNKAREEIEEINKSIEEWEYRLLKGWEKPKFKEFNPKIHCNDGTIISVQASSMHWSIPKDDVGPYTHVECGFPTAVPHKEMLKYLDDKENNRFPLESVYPYVPIEIVQEFFDLHGGIKKGKLP